MKIKSLIITILAALGMLSCVQAPKEDFGSPSLSLSKNALSFEKESSSQDISLNATREWMVDVTAEALPDWISVSPMGGKASNSVQNVTITVLENTGLERSAEVKFTIGMVSRKLTVTQAGPQGSVEDLIVYSNNLDKTKAEKADSGWNTYLDSFDGWKNEKGTGISSVSYEYFGKVTVRTNSGNGSAGQYSDYVELGASGMNYFWFGTGNPAFLIKNITLPEGKKDYTLSFGAERYLYQADDNTFSWDEFKAYISADGKKWVKLACNFAGGKLPNGRWDLASSTFTVPSGTSSLYVYFSSNVDSAYAIDDISLVQSVNAGTAVDFAAGEELELGTPGGSGGSGDSGDSGDVEKPSTLKEVTIAEFLAAAEDDTWYKLTGEIIDIAKEDYGNFTIKDETGEVYIYGMTSKWVGSNDKSFSQIGLKVGDVVTLGTQRGSYQGAPQGGGNPVPAYYISHVAGEGGGDSGDTGNEGEPSTLIAATIAEFLAAAEDDTWYKLTGEIINIAKEDYGNFTIKDETGEVYIYGMTSKWVGSNDKSFSQIGLKVGDVVTLGTQRGSYDGAPQGGGNPVPAYYISHVAGEAPEVTPTSGKYVQVTASQSDWTGKYLIVFGTSVHATLTSKDLNATVKNVTISNGEIAANTDVDAAAVTVSATGDSYSVLLPGGKYFGMQHNGCKNYDSPFAVNIEYTSDGMKISGYVEEKSNTYILYHNSNNGDYYRCYVEKNGQAGYSLPQLYKFVAE